MFIRPSLIVILATRSSIRWSGMISDFALKSIFASCLPRALRSSGSVDHGPLVLAGDPEPPEPLVLFPALVLVEGAMNGVRLTVPPESIAVIIGLAPVAS